MHRLMVRACFLAPRSQCSPTVQIWPWQVCYPSRDLWRRCTRAVKTFPSRSVLPSFIKPPVVPTAHRPPRWSRPLRVAVRLAISPVQNSPSKDGLQLFGVGWGDGVTADRQLHQGQTHAPDVRLNRVVSALQSLRLLTHTQCTSEEEGRAKMSAGREGWAEDHGGRKEEGGGGGGGADGWLRTVLL